MFNFEHIVDHVVKKEKLRRFLCMTILALINKVCQGTSTLGIHFVQNTIHSNAVMSFPVNRDTPSSFILIIYVYIYIFSWLYRYIYVSRSCVQTAEYAWWSCESPSSFCLNLQKDCRQLWRHTVPRNQSGKPQKTLF